MGLPRRIQTGIENELLDVSQGCQLGSADVHVIEFKDRRIVRFAQYTDAFRSAEAMGVVKGEAT